MRKSIKSRKRKRDDKPKAKSNLSLMVHDIKVPGGVGNVWINGGYMNGGTWTDDTNIKYPAMVWRGFEFQRPQPPCPACRPRSKTAGRR